LPDSVHISGTRASRNPIKTRKKSLEQFQQETHENFKKFTVMMERLMSEVKAVEVPNRRTDHSGGAGHCEVGSLSGADARFGLTDYDDASEALHRLKQVTTVAAYQESFERLSNRVDGLPESFLVGCFIGGLKEEIRLEIKLKNPRQLVDATGVACVVEDKFNLQRRVFSGSRSPGDIYEIEEEYHKESVVPQPDETPTEISFYAISGTILPQTLPLPGRIQNKDIMVLVDGGSTHKFIDKPWVDRFGLIVDHDVYFEVVVCNREKMVCTGRVKDLTIVIQGYTIATDFFVLPMAACPILLGVQWLKTLGPVEIDFEKLTLGFRLAGSSHILQGLKRFRPISSRPYRQPYYQKTKIEKQVRELLQQGLIRPSHDPFSSPVLLVKKSDGTWRFCVDYRALNDITVKDKYPIPTIDELLDELYGAKVFSKLDLWSGCHQIRLREGDIHKTAFRHVINSNGVSVEAAKVEAVLSWPVPTNAKGVRGFLRLAGYYRKFIKGFGSIAAPLHKLVGKGPFVWDEAANKTFELLKIALTTTSTLGLRDWSKPFTIECDASGVGIGAVLTQNGKSFASFSAHLKGTMLSWSTYEKEMLAVVKAVHDCQSSWGIRRELVIEELMPCLDVLSSSLWLFRIHVPPYGLIFKKRDGVWFRDGAILLSPSSPLLPTILDLGHLSPEGCHFGLHKTVAKIRTNFWWVGLKASVKTYLKECQICQRFKSDSMQPTGLLQPLPIPERVWEDISMDFIEGLPISNGFSVIMVVVDRLSKYAHFIPLRHLFTAATVAREFVNSIVRLHGFPSTMVSDRDKIFISSFCQPLFKLQGTVLYMSSSYHPQTNGQTEVVNRTLKQYLRCFTGDRPKKWNEWLPWAEYNYNTSIHTSTKMMPFQVVYGRLPPKLVPYISGTTKVQEVDEYLCDRDEVLMQLRHNLLASQNRMKVNADRNRRELEFKVGDLVYIKLQPYRQASVGRPREDATWETKWRFVRAYPDFRLEDKATVIGLGSHHSFPDGVLPKSHAKMRRGKKEISRLICVFFYALENWGGWKMECPGHGEEEHVFYALSSFVY
nr:retrotransposable element Tf2 [Tanacetum cinerariifolium]